MTYSGDAVNTNSVDSGRGKGEESLNTAGEGLLFQKKECLGPGETASPGDSGLKKTGRGSERRTS